jgi:hypothetical protein
MKSTDMVTWVALGEWKETKSINDNNFGTKVSFI